VSIFVALDCGLLGAEGSREVVVSACCQRGEGVEAQSSTSAVAADRVVDAGSEGGKGAEWQMATKGKAKAGGAKRTTIRVRPSPFIVRDNSGPCYHCNRYGHKQASCTSYLRCAVCSKGHRRDECPNEDSPKCPACDGAHTAFDWACKLYPRYYRHVGQQKARTKQGQRGAGIYVGMDNSAQATLTGACLKLVVASWCSARLPIGSEIFSGLSDPETTLEGVPPTPSLKSNTPASMVLEVLLVCTQLAKSALLDDVNDDSVCDKVEKKSSRP
jgi:hypothetical protein